MKVIFMGTPDFAESSLKALIETGHEILCVVTQPDKPKGRKGELTPSPVKVTALENGFTVLQPVKVREPEFVEKIREYAPDVIVVVAFGQIIPESILNIPKYGCVNIHGSLLPKYRGAAPIQWAVINGEKESGVTSMLMDKGLDTGDILLKRAVLLDERETSGSLFYKLMKLGADTLVETLSGLEKGEIKPEKQGETPTEYAKMLTKAMGEIDFNKSAEELDFFVRGMDPWPSAYTFLNEKTIKIWSAKALNTDKKDLVPGRINSVNKDSFIIECGSGELEISEVQLEGKKRMKAADFLKGTVLKAGYRLGE